MSSSYVVALPVVRPRMFGFRYFARGACADATHHHSFFEHRQDIGQEARPQCEVFLDNDHVNPNTCPR